MPNIWTSTKFKDRFFQTGDDMGQQAAKSFHADNTLQPYGSLWDNINGSGKIHNYACQKDSE